MIEDNESSTKIMSDYLTLKGHDCTVLNDGRSGLNLILEQKFDAVIMDLARREFTGNDIIDYLEKSGKIKEQKIILFTASDLLKEEIDHILRNGIIYLNKSVGMNVLNQTIIA